jgi:hypothetical protein
MKFLRIALVALGAIALVPVPPARGDMKGTLAAFAQRLSVRMGVARDSLVVLPLVMEDAPAAGAAPLVPPAGTETWQRPPESQILVDVAGGKVSAANERFVAEGTLLVGGDVERMTGRPFPLRDDERARTATVVCDSRSRPAEAAPPQHVGRLAPFEQRKLLLIGRHSDSLALLQRIQCIVAGVPETTETVSEVLASKYCADVERDRMTDLAKIPKAYAGRTVGHIAFFGYRPVEVVAFARPADYQALGPAYLRSIAVSHAFWAELLGGAAARSADDEMRRLVAEGTAVLASFASADPREQPGVSGEQCRWKIFAGAAQSSIRAGGHPEDFVYRFAADEKGAVVHLEAAESGSDLVYPPPYRDPGGRPVGEPPSNKGGGMNPESMQRILERIRQIRAGR